MKYLKFIIIALCSFYMISCESELDIEPQQSVSEEVATSTADNIEAILVGAYNTGRGNYDGDIANISVLFGNTDQVEWNGTFSNLRDIYFKEMIDDNASANTVYGNYYLLFGNVNTVLANLEKFSDVDRRDRVEGEAKFLRGLAYFDMARLFGQQYTMGAVNSQDAVPIVLDPPNITREVPRNSVEEVYTRAISDLIDAYAILPENNGNRADKFAARAILARIYLQQGNYAAARDAANDVIENSGHTLMPTFSAVFDSDNNTTETLFSWVITVQEGVNRHVQHFATEALGGRGGDISVTPDYLNKFDSPLDERGNFFYIEEGLTLSLKYVRQFANTEQVRLAEMYLIRAEANFREGSSLGMDPLTEINTLRARSSAPALGALTLDIILNERELELGFEGFVLHDYKRTQRDIAGMPYNDNKLIFPIPQSAIDRNPLLNQNPDY